MKKRNYTIQKQSPHIGNMLQARIKFRRISRASVARLLKRAPQTFNEFTKRHTLQTEILWQICNAMKHNFFADLAAQLPADFTTYAPDPTLALQEALEQLKEENKLLNAQLATLKEVMRKG